MNLIATPKHLLALLLGVLLLAAIQGLQAEEEKVDRAPEFVLPDAEGNMVSLSDYRGRPVVLHFWATWCPYCKKLHPGLEALAERHKDEGLVILAVSFKDKPENLPQKVIYARGQTFKTLVDGDEVAELYGVRGTPTTFFLDANNKIVGRTHTSDPDDPILEEGARAAIDNAAVTVK
jgi:thiol-disulfide isomerase/thioredoxin